MNFNTKETTILKKEQGITIIVLIITIIILIILAGVSINALSGDNGVIKKAVEARDKTEKDQIIEKLELIHLAVSSANKNGYTKEELEEQLKKEFGNDYNVDDSDRFTWTISGNGESITIPAGNIKDIKKYTIAYDSNGGIGTLENQVLLYEEESNLVENVFTKDGYIFTGWNTNADGTGESYENGQKVKNIGDKTLYAQWREVITTSLKTGQTINDAMKRIARNLTNIIYIRKENSIPDEYKIEGNNISETSNVPVYIWFEDGTIKYYSEADEIYLNANSSFLFNNLSKVKEIDLKFKTDRATTMKQMFYNCNALENIDLSGFNTSNVKDMSSMFGNCVKLKKLDLEKFNTAKVTAMDNMFNGSNNIEELNVSSFNTENLKTMSRMFSSMKKLRVLDVSSFNTSKVTNMEKMFDNMNELTTIYASDGFVTQSVSKSGNMFINDSKLVGGKGTKYNSSKVDKTYAVIDTESTPGYFTNIADKK